jgi:hypothetical protein
LHDAARLWRFSRIVAASDVDFDVRETLPRQKGAQFGFAIGARFRTRDWPN